MSERFWQKVSKSPDGCWNWTAAKTSGYGVFSIDGAIRRAHRISYEITNGPIPDGLVLDHLCRNRACVRPSHLEPVTLQENIARGEAGKYQQSDRCSKGHKYIEKPWRQHVCMECARVRNKEYRVRRSKAYA